MIDIRLCNCTLIVTNLLHQRAGIGNSDIAMAGTGNRLKNNSRCRMTFQSDTPQTCEGVPFQLAQSGICLPDCPEQETILARIPLRTRWCSYFNVAQEITHSSTWPSGGMVRMCPGRARRTPVVGIIRDACIRTRLSEDSRAVLGP